MEKTGQMIEFEEETGGYAIVTVKVGFAELQFPSEIYVEWLEAELLKASVKATAYYLIMSGGKKTLKELANFLGKPITVDKSGAIFAHEFVPHTSFGDMWVSNFFDCMAIHPNLIDYTGDWKESLTLPDGWEEK